jgi:hypothetical protein
MEQETNRGLIRDMSPDGKCKYALVRLDRLREASPVTKALGEGALDQLQSMDLLEYGEKGTAEEFFVLKLKDRFAARAIEEYARQVRVHARQFDNPEWLDQFNDLMDYAKSLAALADRAYVHPGRKIPCTRYPETTHNGIAPEPDQYDDPLPALTEQDLEDRVAKKLKHVSATPKPEPPTPHQDHELEDDLWTAGASGGGIVRSCERHGGTWFNGEDHGGYEEGELEELREKAKTHPDKYHELDRDAHDTTVLGKEYIWTCAGCRDEFYRLQEFLWRHRHTIATYLNARLKREAKEAAQDLKQNTIVTPEGNPDTKSAT